MKKYPIRELIAMKAEDIWNNLRGSKFIVICEDGVEMVTDRKETWLSSIMWKIFQEYPLKVYECKHHFAHYFKKKQFKPTSHFELLQSCGFSAFDQYRGTLSNERLAQILFESHIELCNEITLKFGKYVGTLDLYDIIDLMMHPDIKVLRDNLQPNEQSINTTIKKFETMVMDPNSSVGKMNVCYLAQTRQIKVEQLTSAALVRGYTRDVDSSVFPKPIMRSYVEGIRSMADFLAESRGAAVAIEMASNPLQMAAFSSRKLQFIDSIITTLHRGDCGSKKTMSVTIRDAEYDEIGNVSRVSDLEVWEGIIYHLGDGVLRELSVNDKQLIGVTINARNVLDCQHPDPHGVCEVCLGKIADTYFESTNVGTNASTTFMRDLLQLLLSAKHHLSSADAEKILLDRDSIKYFITDTSQMNYILRDDLPTGINLLLSPLEATNLADIDLEEIDISAIDRSRLGAIRTVGFEYTDGRVDSIQIGIKRRPAMMSVELLEYAKENRWSFDSRGNFRIKLNNWNSDNSMFSLPLRNYNIADHTKDLAEFIEARADQLYERDANISPYEFLLELSDLVNKKSAVSIGILQIVMKGLTIVSAEERNYHMPKPGERMGIGVLNPLMNNRSVSIPLGYMGHRDLLKNPANFVLKDRPDHPMDVMIMPQEYMEAQKRSK